MIDIVKTRSVLNRIAHAKDPLSLMRKLVLESGGTWIDAATVNIAYLNIDLNSPTHWRKPSSKLPLPG